MSTLNINTLPVELLVKILLDVDIKTTVLSLIKVCPRWSKLILENIKVIDFNHKLITTDWLNIFNNECPKVTRIELEGCLIITNDEICWIASKCPNLSYLNITDNENISAFGINSIIKFCPHIIYIDLFYCPKITSVSINAIIQKYPNLIHLDIGSNRDHINIDDIKPFRLEKLKSLHMGSSSFWLTYDIFKLIILGCPNIINIDLYQCSSITDEWLKLISENCPCLKTINLQDCDDDDEEENENISDEGMKAIADKCINLKDITFSENHTVSYDMLDSLKDCSNLNTLYINNCCNVTDNCLNLFKDYFRNLKTLDISRCALLSDVAIQNLKKERQELKIFII